jgi:hypothetical protein
MPSFFESRGLVDPDPENKGDMFLKHQLFIFLGSVTPKIKAINSFKAPTDVTYILIRLEFHQKLFEKLETRTATLTLNVTYLYKKTLRL